MTLVSCPNMFFKQLMTMSLNAPKRTVPKCKCALSPVRFVSSKLLSDTSIMLQSGTDIQELPLAVKKVCSADASHILFCENISKNHFNKVSPPHAAENSSGIPRQEEIDEIVSGFDKCNAIPEVLKLLEVLPSSYVEPVVAFRIIKKMSELEENQLLHCERMGEEVTHNFTTNAIFNQLIGTILTDNDCAILVNCLKLINQRSVFRRYFEPYCDKLIEQIMINMTKNMFSVTEVCEIAEEFHNFGCLNEVDKLWIGVAENAKSICADNIINVFHALPYFKTSRNMVTKILLERMADVWWYMEGKDVIELLAVVKNVQISSSELMQICGRWLNTKIHAVSEEELQAIVKGFADLNFVNSQIISALERYVKMRSELISDPTLMAALAEYCDRFRIRSPLILERMCDYFIAKGQSLSPAVVRSLVVPFGNLYFPPTRSYEFWKTFEQVVETKFTYFKPEHVVDLMLLCIYLEKYPINFVNYIFNPYFLTRLQISSENWSTTKNNLTVFDHHMTTHCAAYKGPLLPREVPLNFFTIDKQIKVVLLKVKEALIKNYGHKYFVKETKILFHCPMSPRCMIDIYMKPRNVASGANANPLAVLIHMPEDYAHDGKSLLGSQHLRIRHFTEMGMKVISLKYGEVVAKYAQVCDLAEYLKESIDAVVNVE